MVRFGTSDDLRGAEFVATNLRGARFRDADLSGVVMRSIEADDLEIDSPWLFDSDSALLVNGVDVLPLVDAELDRRNPGRSLRRAGDPDGLREAWVAVQGTWAATLERAAAMPSGTVGASVGGEWSFAETLRHLVMATDTWPGCGVHDLTLEQALHPIGRAHTEFESDGYDTSVFSTTTPSYDEVLEVRAGRVGQVRDFLASVTADQLVEPRRNPWAPDREVSVLQCLHVILDEEWEHHRYAVRDLDALQGGAGADGSVTA